jgi:DNA replication protein DnaC
MRNCASCNKPFETDSRKLDFFCVECEYKRAKERERLNEQKISAAWNSLCPATFQQTDPAKLPNQHAYRRALAWQYGPQGLLLHGKTGSGKTRTAWEVLKREHFAGHSFGVVNSSAALKFAAMFAINSANAEMWVQKFCETSVLLMDDVFKVKLTEAFEAGLFSIVDRRNEALRPIIVTTNDVGETLAERMSGDRANPFIRRLRENCDAIEF